MIEEGGKKNIQDSLDLFVNLKNKKGGISMKIRKVMLLGLSVCFMLMVNNSLTFAKVYKMKFASMAPPGSADTLAGDWWTSEVEKRTGGRVKIDKFWSGSLVGGYEQLHAVKTGVIQLTWLYSGYHPDHAPLTAIALLPCINVGNPKVAIAAMDEWMRTNKAIGAELTRNKVKYLFPYNVANHYLWSMVPLDKLSKFDGLRLRSWGLNYTLLKKWKCGLVSLPVPEVYDALERKAVDATTMYISNGVALRLHEVVKYLNVSELGHNLGCPAVMNMKTWNKLPGDIQKIIAEVNGEMVDKCSDIAVELYDKNMKIVKEAGLVIQKFSPEEEKELFDAAKNVVWEEYVKKVDSKGLQGTDTLKHYLQLQEKYSKIYR